jgi:sigma-54 dependent transcriptional regulator, acetoin dehydrogenase operon transcriptional activator AcoR
VTSGRPFATSGVPLSGPTRRGAPSKSRERATATAWERFVAGEEVGEGVRPEILLSWYRCRDDFKVDPRQERAPSAPDDQPIHSLEDDVVAAELGGAAKSIEPDAEALDGLVAVTDGQGRILAAWGSRQALNFAGERNLGPRCTWSENMTGTNGMGTALVSGDPVLVRGAEHWCSGFHDWGCAGIAIRDPVTNHPLGVLDVSSRKKPFPDAVLNWLRRAGQRVEAGLRDQALRSFCDLVTVFREQERAATGVLAAADKSGRLVLANEEAQQLFGTGRPDPPRELQAALPHLKEVMVKAVERARRDRLWAGLARLYVPTAGSHLTVAFQPPMPTATASL